MRNSAGFIPVQLPQFTWPSIDKRRNTSTVPEAESPPIESVDENLTSTAIDDAAPVDAPPTTVADTTGEEAN